MPGLSRRPGPYRGSEAPVPPQGNAPMSYVSYDPTGRRFFGPQYTQPKPTSGNGAYNPQPPAPAPVPQPNPNPNPGPGQGNGHHGGMPHPFGHMLNARIFPPGVMAPGHEFQISFPFDANQIGQMLGPYRMPGGRPRTQG